MLDFWWFVAGYWLLVVVPNNKIFQLLYRDFASLKLLVRATFWEIRDILVVFIFNG
jgi:hypothetical protein